MASKNINSKQGFTIIEVVLVLAIAGLIFLTVFVALPALQRSQRDTQRRNDMSRVDTSLVQYQTNNSTKSNNLPDVTSAVSWTGTETIENCGTNQSCIFIRDYMNSGSSENNKVNEFQDPDGKPYSLVITPNWDVYGAKTATYSPAADADLGDVSSKLEVKNGKGTITGNDPFSAYVIYIVPGGRCDGEYVIKSQKRHFAILYRLEGAGVYCIDDQ